MSGLQCLPGDFEVRALRRSDLDKGYLQLLGQLTVAGSESAAELLERFEEIQRLQPYYRILVIEDHTAARIVASGTLLIELKFHRGCGSIGHIEDVVVDVDYRGSKLGLRIVNELVAAARAAGCYKVILDCSEGNVDFYAKSGFQRKEAQYF